VLDGFVARRLRGEPLAWITGQTVFAGVELAVDPGVYVPRWQSEPLARRAAVALPERGVALDLCCGCGAFASVMAEGRPAATVIATDADPRAIRSALGNGVDARLGDLFEPVPHTLMGDVDVITAVAPYVPTPAMRLLPRDTLAFEPALALDGGPDGTSVVARIVRGAAEWLRPRGLVLLEIGGDQLDPVAALLEEAAFEVEEALRDEEGDVRGVIAALLSPPGRADRRPPAARRR
jgi:release factor glutamine methyltransferase